MFAGASVERFLFLRELHALDKGDEIFPDY